MFSKISHRLSLDSLSFVVVEIGASIRQSCIETSGSWVENGGPSPSTTLMGVFEYILSFVSRYRFKPHGYHYLLFSKIVSPTQLGHKILSLISMVHLVATPEENKYLS